MGNAGFVAKAARPVTFWCWLVCRGPEWAVLPVHPPTRVPAAKYSLFQDINNVTSCRNTRPTSMGGLPVRTELTSHKGGGASSNSGSSLLPPSGQRYPDTPAWPVDRFVSVSVWKALTCPCTASGCSFTRIILKLCLRVCY